MSLSLPLFLCSPFPRRDAEQCAGQPTCSRLRHHEYAVVIASNRNDRSTPVRQCLTLREPVLSLVLHPLRNSILKETDKAIVYGVNEQFLTQFDNVSVDCLTI